MLPNSLPSVLIVGVVPVFDVDCVFDADCVLDVDCVRDGWIVGGWVVGGWVVGGCFSVFSNENKMIITERNFFKKKQMYRSYRIINTRIVLLRQNFICGFTSHQFCKSLLDGNKLIAKDLV